LGTHSFGMNTTDAMRGRAVFGDNDHSDTAAQQGPCRRHSILGPADQEGWWFPRVMLMRWHASLP
jgi:hypothetical protein